MEKKVKVNIPKVPNFIKVGNEFISVTEFTEDELNEIGKEWTAKLIARSKDRIKKGLDN